jgi:galactokinase
MTGGGFGGCVLALIDADQAENTSAAVAAAYAERGFTPATTWIAVAGPGAARL